jgi:hypothetical protein
VKVTIELQVPSEGVRNDYHEDPDTMLDSYPLLNHFGAQSGQVVYGRVEKPKVDYPGTSYDIAQQHLIALRQRIGETVETLA